MAVQNPIGIALAGLLSLPGPLRVRGLYRTIIFLPTTLSVVIVGFPWNLILSPLWGRRRGRFEAVGPGRLFALARVDGLAYLCILPHIKLPLVLPTIGLVSILSFVGNFKAFDLIDSVKGALAGPNFATDILGTFFDRTFLGDQLKLGNPMMGSAVATVMFFIILAGVCLWPDSYSAACSPTRSREAWDRSNRSDDACRPHPGDEPRTDRAGRQTARTYYAPATCLSLDSSASGDELLSGRGRKHRGRHGADRWRLGRPFGLPARLLKPGAAVTSKFAPSTNAPPRATS
jgi:hypothetical protein